MSIWELSLVLMKLGLYLSTALFIGGTLAAWSCRTSTPRLHYTRKLVLTGGVSGVLLSLLGYLVLVGQFNDTGFQGMFDTQMITMLWSSDIGKQTQWRLFAFLLVTATWYLHEKAARSPGRFFKLLAVGNASIAIVALTFSYTLTGHTAEKDVLAIVSLMAHVGFVTWWVGCVIALVMVCARHEPREIKAIMMGFGSTATLFVPVIFLYGIALSVQIIPSWQTFSQPYGITLLVKFGFFMLVLLLAARHKYQLVPRLENQPSVRKLKLSIVLELTLLLIILVITAVLSSTMGAHNT